MRSGDGAVQGYRGRCLKSMLTKLAALQWIGAKLNAKYYVSFIVSIGFDMFVTCLLVCVDSVLRGFNPINK